MTRLTLRRLLERRRLRRIVAAVALPLLLVACGGGGPVGKGIAPTRMVLAAADANTLTPAVGAARVFQCFTGALAAFIYFTDGSAGNYSGRVHWSSVEPGVVAVSNGDIASPGGGFYPSGTLVAVSPGTTTIRADFSALHQELTVTVGAPSAFSIKAVLNNLPIPITDYAMGVGTTQQFRVSAIVDGVSRDASAFAQWRIGGAGLASAGAGGLLTAQGPGDATLTAHFPLCAQDASVALHIGNVNGISSSLEYGSDALLLGNSEHVTVTAALDNGSTQDVSAQARISSPTPDVVTLYSGTASNLLLPVAAGTGTIQASLLNLYTAPDITVNISEGTLTGFSIAPQSAVIRAGSDEVVPFKATGSFDNGQVQDATHLVSWAVVNTTLGSVSNATDTAGFVRSTGSFAAIGQTQVIATPPATSSASPVAAMVTFDSTTDPAPP